MEIEPKIVNIACIVDDDVVYIYGIKKMLRKNPLCKELKVFHNGYEALEYFKDLTNEPKDIPDIIILDINMPVMDGWEFLEEFVPLQPKLSKEVIIYMVSSSIDNNDVEKAKSISAISDYIVKPITEDKLAKLFSAS
jgi:CheY-like chemotaxis protein